MMSAIVVNNRGESGGQDQSNAFRLLIWAITCAALILATFFIPIVAYADEVVLQAGSALTASAKYGVDGSPGFVAEMRDCRHSGVVKCNGSLWMWGDNSAGQIGDGSSGNKRTSPVKVMDGVEYATLRGNNSAAIKADGSLWMWGDNSTGQIGDGSSGNVKASPVKVMDEVSSVYLGKTTSAAIKTDGSLWVWGSNSRGQVGDGTTADRTKPVKVLDNVASVKMASYWTCAVTKDGDLYTWGYNGNGELCDGTYKDRPTPKKVVSGVAAVDASNSGTVILKADGTVCTCGHSGYGELGFELDDYSKTEPFEILDDVTQMRAGCYDAIARVAMLKSDGSLWVSGSGAYSRFRPMPVKMLDGVSSIVSAVPLVVTTDDGGLVELAESDLRTAAETAGEASSCSAG